MQYKTITLELLQERPELYDQLLQNRTLLATLDFYATELRDSHLDWKEMLQQRNPRLHPQQIASEALELAIEDLVKHLPSPFPSGETLSLDGAMTFVRSHTPHA